MSRKVKLQLYQCAVGATMEYGHEAWLLSADIEAKVRNWNCRNLYHITGRSHRDEYVTPSYDLFTAIRRRRLTWLGHVLRHPEDHWLLKRFVIQEWEMGKANVEGSLFMDVPERFKEHGTIADLSLLAQDRDIMTLWCGLMGELKLKN